MDPDAWADAAEAEAERAYGRMADARHQRTDLPSTRWAPTPKGEPAP